MEKLTAGRTLRKTSIPKWYEMTRETCPICGHAGGCMIQEEGEMIACIRKESDHPFSQNSACPSWLHWLNGDRKRTINKQDIEQEVSETKRESVHLDKVFRGLIDCTILEDSHYDHLTGPSRKLSDDQIFTRQYRSFPQKPWQTVQDIEQLSGLEDFTGVPGFYKVRSRNGEFWSLAGRDGILIPFRNIRNEIEGFQMRVDNPPNDVVIKRRKEGLQARVIQQPNIVQVSYNGEVLYEKEFELKKTETIYYEKDIVGYVELVKGKRYFWFSSANKLKGTGSGQPAPVHVSVPSHELAKWQTGEVRKAHTAWIGEGPLKQDIAVDIISKMYDEEELEDIGTTMLGLPGVGSWRLALPILKEMGIKKVIICFDMDAISNPYVLKHLKECSKALKEEGYVGELALWDGDNHGKGIDDCLIKNRLPNFRRLF